jgi:hypothetical protein
MLIEHWGRNLTGFPACLNYSSNTSRISSMVLTFLDELVSTFDGTIILSQLCVDSSVVTPLIFGQLQVSNWLEGIFVSKTRQEGAWPKLYCYYAASWGCELHIQAGAQNCDEYQQLWFKMTFYSAICIIVWYEPSSSSKPRSFSLFYRILRTKLSVSLKVFYGKITCLRVTILLLQALYQWKYRLAYWENIEFIFSLSKIVSRRGWDCTENGKLTVTTIPVIASFSKYKVTYFK